MLMYEMSKKRIKELEQEFIEKKLENMTFKELSLDKKVEHIWDYYKLHIIGSIIGLAVIISMIITIVNNINTITILDATFFTREFESATLEETQQYWYDLLYDPNNSKKQVVLIDHINIRDDLAPDAQMGNQAKIMAKSTTRDFDLFVMDKDFILENGDGGLLMDLNTIIDVEALGIDESRLYYKGDQLIGIEVTDHERIDPFTFLEEPLYLGCFYGSLNVENLKIVIKDLFN